MLMNENWLKDSDIERWSLAYKEGGPAYTLIVEDVPVACAGIILQEWNKAEAWALLSFLFYRHKIKAYRAIKAGLEAFIAEKKLQRVQAVVVSEDQPGIDFIECLGFECEGELKNFGPQHESFYMYARTR